MNAIEHIRRKVFAISQAELAEIAGTTQATVCRWEQGLLSPDINQATAIRAEAKLRKHKWKDAWLFGELPSTSQTSPEQGA